MPLDHGKSKAKQKGIIVKMSDNLRKSLATKKTGHGFTIVELLIVIVVIGILAAISIVSYNGISQRAENNKTIAAAEGYFKAIKMYQSEVGDVPRGWDGVCLGQDYPWDFAGTSSGSNQCMSSSVSYYMIKGNTNAELGKYISPLPQPSMKAVGDSSSWVRGVVYYHTGTGGTYRLKFPLQGNQTCPAITGETPTQNALTGGVSCTYIIAPV